MAACGDRYSPSAIAPTTALTFFRTSASSMLAALITPSSTDLLYEVVPLPAGLFAVTSFRYPLNVFILLLYLYLSDFFFVPSDRGINPFAFKCAMSVKPALPDLYLFIASLVSGAFSLNCLKVFIISKHLLYYLFLFLSLWFRFYFIIFPNIELRNYLFLFFNNRCFKCFHFFIIYCTVGTIFNFSFHVNLLPYLKLVLFLLASPSYQLHLEVDHKLVLHQIQHL